MDTSRRRVVAAVAAVVLAIALGTWFLLARRSGASDNGPLVVRATRSADGKTEEIKLPPVETDKLIQRAHAHIQQQLDEYFSLAAGKARKDYLDQKIDQFEEVRKMIGDPDKPQPPATQPGETRRIVMRSAGGAAGQKAMHETLPAEVQARLAEYQRDMAARRAERGLPADTGGTFVRINVSK
jgi:hypothetical protein